MIYSQSLILGLKKLKISREGKFSPLSVAMLNRVIRKKTSFILFHVGSNTTYSTGDFAVSEPLMH